MLFRSNHLARRMKLLERGACRLSCDVVSYPLDFTGAATNLAASFVAAHESHAFDPCTTEIRVMFLCLSSSSERNLKLGRSAPEVEERILGARGFLEEYQVALPGIVQQLLVDHDTGKNGPVRTELLAQLLEVLQQQATEALSPGPWLMVLRIAQEI